MRITSRSLLLAALTAFGITFLSYHSYMAIAQFIGPGNCSPGMCSGAIAVDSANDVGLGSAGTTTARLYVIGSSTAGTYAIKASGTIYSVTGGFKFPDGTTQTTAAAGGGTASTTAENVKAGAFGANWSGGNYSFSGSVGIGTTGPTGKLHIDQGDSSTPSFKGTLSAPANTNVIYIQQTNAGGTGADATGLIFMDNRGNAPSLTFQNNGTTKFMVRQSGSVYAPIGFEGLALNADQYALTKTYSAASNEQAIFITQSNAGGDAAANSSLVRIDNRGSNPTFYSSNGGSNPFVITAGGNIGIGNTGPTYKLDIVSAGATTARFGTASSDKVVVGGGSGKIDAGTVDPVYTIGGTRYATYLPGMTGQNEETAGHVECSVSNDQCAYTIDFKDLKEGSALWLFAKATDLTKHFGDLTVLLTPAFDGKVWYEDDLRNLRLVIHAVPSSTSNINAPTSLKVSYRLTAPRFDAADWTNYSNASYEGFNLDKLGIN